jgi:hypothetical protein
MATLVIHTKPAQQLNRPTMIERFAQRFYTSRLNTACREIERRSFYRQGSI